MCILIFEQLEKVNMAGETLPVQRTKPLANHVMWGCEMRIELLNVGLKMGQDCE